MTPDQSQQAIEALAPFSTAQLVEALMAREGVRHCFAEPDDEYEIAVWPTPTMTAPKTEYRKGGMHEVQAGPALLLEVVD